MPKPLPPRPAADFKITTFAWQINSEKNHGNAGFPRISEEVLRRRFFQFLSFLQANGMTTRTVAETIDEVNHETELKNSDLNEPGYRFVQRYVDRWIGRTYKDKGEEKEQSFLKKWHEKLTTESGDA
jgi:hypothetical protein